MGLVSVSPIAFDDSYNAITNPVTLNVPDGISDTFANDYPGLNPAVTGLTSFGGGSLGGAVTDNPAGSTDTFGTGGSLTVNANGSFDFTPAVGFQGVFTFFYRLQNFVGPADGLVSLIVDAPPSVVSTTPISGATGITATTNITVTFSESVTYTASSFSLECPSGSPVAFSLASTSPSTSAVLDPTGNLPAGVVCTVTVLAAQITDADTNDPPDTMENDYVFTFAVPPLANDDTYSSQIIGNVGISTTNSTNFSVLTNDQGPGLSITAFGATSTQGGTVAVITSTGTFSYTPPRGFEGTDSFTYTIGNAAGSDTASVNLTVSGMIWFVDTNAGGGGDGRLNSPYNTLAAFQAVNDGVGSNPAAGDNIFLYESATAYTGGVTLLNGQRLIGQDATVTLAAATGLTVPADSFALPLTNSGNLPIALLNSAATAITLGSGNTLRGLTVGDTTANDISGTNFGTLTVLETTLNGTGRALNLDTGSFNAATTFDGVTSTSGANNVNLVSVGGTANLGGGALSGATGNAFNLDSGTATISYSGTINNSTARSVSVTNKSGGTVTFGGAVSGTGTGIFLNNNTGATINFSGGGMNLNTGANAAFTATGGGTVNVIGSNNTITTTTSTAVNITTPTNIGGSGVTFRSITVNNGASASATSGIVLNDTTGSFTVTGDGTLARNGSGGTINRVTNDAIDLNNASNVTLQSMNLTNNGDTAPASATNAESTTGDQTVQINGGSNIVLSGMLIQNPTGTGILALNLGGTNRVNNNSRIENLSATAGHGIYVNNTNTNMTLFEFQNSQMVNNASSFANFFFANTGTSNMTLDVKGSTFEDLGIQAITAAAGGVAATTGTLNSTIGGPAMADRNFFQNAKGVGENNVGILVNNGATHNSTVENNLFDNIAEDGSIANTSVIRTQNNGGVMNATVKNNTIQNITYATGGRHAIGHVFEPASFSAGNSSTLDFDGNTISGITFSASSREAIFIDFRANASGGNVKVRNNNFTLTNGSPSQQAMELRFRQTNASTVNLQVSNNTGSASVTGLPYIDVDVEAAATVNATITNNPFTNTNGTPSTTVDMATEAAGTTGCLNISGNTLNHSPGMNNGTININETAGTLNVTQASAAAVASANGIPAGNVTVGGTPAFGQPACPTPP